MCWFARFSETVNIAWKSHDLISKNTDLILLKRINYLENSRAWRIARAFRILSLTILSHVRLLGFLFNLAHVIPRYTFHSRSPNCFDAFLMGRVKRLSLPIILLMSLFSSAKKIPTPLLNSKKLFSKNHRSMLLAKKVNKQTNKHIK